MSSKHLHILIADDNAGQAQTLAMILRRHGHQVTTVENGQQAIEESQRCRFDLALLDVKMPIVNGIEACRQLKHSCPQTVVVLMTAYAVDDLLAEAFAQGATDVLYKPVELDRLLELLNGAVASGRPASVLLVDDDQGYTAVLQRILERKGYSVTQANSGEAAIAAVHAKEPGIVFLDMKLPCLSGLETFRRIQQTSPDTVVILITAYRQEMADQIKTALRQGALLCLYKPLDIDAILRVLQQVNGQNR